MVFKIATPFPIHSTRRGRDDEGDYANRPVDNAFEGTTSQSQESVYIQEKLQQQRPITPYGDDNNKEDSIGDIRLQLDEIISKIPTIHKIDISEAENIEESIFDGLQIGEELEEGSEEETQDILEEWSNTSTFDSKSNCSTLLDYVESEPQKEFDFTRHFRKALNKERKLIFEFEDFLEEETESELFPETTKVNRDRAKITSGILKTLKIVAPKALNSEMNNSSEPQRSDYIDDNKEERRIRDKVRYLLRTTQSYCLDTFEFLNEGDGADLCDGIGRLEVWRTLLQRFLRRHSATLERISIRSLMMHQESFPIAEKDDGLGKFYKFPNLTELEIIFWNPKQEKKKFVGNLENNYWVQLLRSRAHFGNLKRIVWMSSINLSFPKIWGPILHHNQNTLETVHILKNENQRMLEENVYFSISLAPFSDMQHLKSLYLENSHCFAHHMRLLPTSLRELSLDGICLESAEIKLALKKLVNLKTLRLVNNNFPLKDQQLSPLESQMFGVNLDVVKVILQHRNLESLFIWGHTLTQPVLNEPQIQRKSRSKFQRFKHFCTSLKTVKKSKPELAIPQGQTKKLSEVIQILLEIAKVDKFSICIQPSDKPSLENKLTLVPLND